MLERNVLVRTTDEAGFFVAKPWGERFPATRRRGAIRTRGRWARSCPGLLRLKCRKATSCVSPRNRPPATRWRPARKGKAAQPASSQSLLTGHDACCDASFGHELPSVIVRFRAICLWRSSGHL